jgi:hypothetical protein
MIMNDSASTAVYSSLNMRECLRLFTTGRDREKAKKQQKEVPSRVSVATSNNT